MPNIQWIIGGIIAVIMWFVSLIVSIVITILIQSFFKYVPDKKSLEKDIAESANLSRENQLVLHSLTSKVSEVASGVSTVLVHIENLKEKIEDHDEEISELQRRQLDDTHPPAVKKK